MCNFPSGGAVCCGMIELIKFGAPIGAIWGQIAVGVHMFGGVQILFATNCLFGAIISIFSSILRTISGMFTFLRESSTFSLFCPPVTASFFVLVSFDEQFAWQGLFN